MVVSFHPLFEGDKHMLCAGRDPGKEELAAIRSARAVILPQGCRESLYRMARNNCRHVFPNYDKRFEYPDKIGQAHLFRNVNAAHPRTETFRTVADFKATYENFRGVSMERYPLVFKFDWGGEGDNVFLLKNEQELKDLLSRAVSYEKTGQYGFILQNFIPSKSRSLRVVVIDTTIMAYWRVQKDLAAFHTNVSKGATVTTESDPLLLEEGKKAVVAFCGMTNINLAGFDLIFSEKSLEKGSVVPLFLEINYFFGRKGLGGSNTYYNILQQAIDNWLVRISP